MDRRRAGVRLVILHARDELEPPVERLEHVAVERSDLFPQARQVRVGRHRRSLPEQATTPPPATRASRSTGPTGQVSGPGPGPWPQGTGSVGTAFCNGRTGQVSGPGPGPWL